MWYILYMWFGWERMGGRLLIVTLVSFFLGMAESMWWIILVCKRTLSSGLDMALWIAYYVIILATDYLLFMRAPQKSLGWTAGGTWQGLYASCRGLCKTKLFRSVVICIILLILGDFVIKRQIGGSGAFICRTRLLQSTTPSF